MSYELHSEKGFVCNLGSANRYNALVNDVEFCSSYGKLCAFLKTGKTDEPKEVLQEITSYVKDNPKFYLLLSELKQGLKKANKFAEIVG